jgi:hypothetical protein
MDARYKWTVLINTTLGTLMAQYMKLDPASRV